MRRLPLRPRLWLVFLQGKMCKGRRRGSSCCINVPSVRGFYTSYDALRVGSFLQCDKVSGYPTAARHRALGQLAWLDVQVKDENSKDAGAGCCCASGTSDGCRDRATTDDDITTPLSSNYMDLSDCGTTHHNSEANFSRNSGPSTNDVGDALPHTKTGGGETSTSAAASHADQRYCQPESPQQGNRWRYTM